MTSSPDFLIIGAAKSGTTTLFDWLGQQPEILLPAVKEPGFFSDELRWERGLDWYMKLFPDLGDDQLTGEASTGYTDADRAEISAERIARTLPQARLIYLVRHPIERLRSHYRHQVQRGRERQPLAAAVGRAGSPYVRNSLYLTCLAPYLERFDPEQIAILRTEDLGREGEAWLGALEHLGLAPRPSPDTLLNVTAAKDGFRAPMRWMWEKGMTVHGKRLPKHLRHLGRRVLMRRDAVYSARLQGSKAPIPEVVEERIWADVEALEQWIGNGLKWVRDAGQGMDVGDGGRRTRLEEDR